MIKRIRKCLLIGGWAVFACTSALSCSRASEFSFDELFSADLIVRAKAVRYVVPPNDNYRTSGVPESHIEFEISEVLYGDLSDKTILIKGYLSENDDLNDQKVPYKFVRRNGRSGSCFANTYKQNAEFLLFLRQEDGFLTPNISALGPTNEQLTSKNDAWLIWVRDELVRRRKRKPTN